MSTGSGFHLSPQHQSAAVEFTECRTVLIGPSARREFSGLVQWLFQQRPIRLLRDFPDVSTALQHSDVLSRSDLTIVLQSWSDQYAAQEVDRLIGQTLSAALLCCYGAWCESDGRNRSIWPDAARIPVRLAQSAITAEVARFAQQLPPLFPTAARDEVFGHRAQDSSRTLIPTAADFATLNAVVIGPDRTLRRTAAMMLRELGIGTASLPLISAGPGTRPRPQETPRGPVHVVLHDLDPFGDAVRESLAAARIQFPVAHLLGFATMPDAGLTTEIADEDLAGVVPKLDMRYGLQWHVRKVLATMPT